MADPTIRPANLAILVKTETTSEVDATPDGTFAVPVEIGSFTRNTPFAEDTSNEASGSLVSAAPLIIGKPATLGWKSRVKGAGAGTTYSATVKPPLHAALVSCGKKALFTAAIASAVATAGTTGSVTLGTGYPATAQALRGQRLLITVAPNINEQPLIVDYSAAKLALLAETAPAAFTVSSSLALPANWTYSGVSPTTAAAELTDMPSATIYVYRGGKLLKFVGCRGSVDFDGKTAGACFATFSFTGIYAGETDAATPALTLAGQSPPLLLQGNNLAEAFAINSLPLPISTFKLTDGTTIESPDNPNTLSGFQGGIIGPRTPKLTCDPLATTVAVRDTLGQIANGSVYAAAIRAGYISGNRFAISFPKVQPVGLSDTDRRQLLAESIEFRINPTGIADASGRDGEYTIVFD